MRVEIMDGVGNAFVITTKNVDLLAVWLVETMAEVKPSREYPARIMVWPGFTWDEHHPRGLPDWITLGPVLSEIGTVHTPLSVVEYLRGQIERVEEWYSARPDDREHAATLLQCAGPDCDPGHHKRRM